MNKTYKFEKDTTSNVLQTLDINAMLKPLSFFMLFNIMSLPTNCIPTPTHDQTMNFQNQKTTVEWKISSNRKVQTAKESVRLKNKLSKIVAQCSDDEDVLPLGVDTIANFIRFLKDCDDADLKGWVLFPNTNGTLSLELRKPHNEISQINIGYSMISYSIKKGDIFVIGKEPFNVEVLLGLLKKVA